MGNWRRHLNVSPLRALACALLCSAVLPGVVMGEDEPEVEALPSSNDAQRYKVLPLPEIDSRAKIHVARMLREGTVSDAAMFEAFWKYRAAEFTLPTNSGNLPDLRTTIKRDAQSATGEARERFLNLMLESMREIASDNFAPAARFNALLVIGDLNQRDALRPEDSIPLAAALPVLIEFLDSNRPVDDINDTLRLAAWIGVLRHAKTSLSNREQVVKIAQETVNTANPPAGRDPQVHEWFRKIAGDVLEALDLQRAQASAR